MTPRTIFTIVVKIFGLSLIYGLIEILPMWIKNLASANTDSKGFIAYIIGIVLVISIYLFIMWASLFRTRRIIDKLSLAKDFDQEVITLNVTGPFLIRLAIIILSCIVLITGVPSLFSDFLYFNRLKKESVEPAGRYPGLSMEKIWTSVNISMAIFNGIRIILGILLLTFNMRIMHWITRKNKFNDSLTEESRNEENKQE